MAGAGTVVGPDISDTRTKTAEMLLGDILNPNQAIDSNYVNYLVTTKSGELDIHLTRGHEQADEGETRSGPFEMIHHCVNEGRADPLPLTRREHHHVLQVEATGSVTDHAGQKHSAATR